MIYDLYQIYFGKFILTPKLNKNTKLYNLKGLIKSSSNKYECLLWCVNCEKCQHNLSKKHYHYKK
jgi:hypothetical protein